jgi:predicted kinase
MSKLYILCGFPGSGKSTWASSVFHVEKALCVSRDAVRTMIGGGTYLFHENTEDAVRFIAHVGINKLLQLGPVIVDETHLTKKKRAEMIDLARSAGALPVIVHFTTDPETCLDRRCPAPRGYSYEEWKSVIEGMVKTFEPPTEDECMVIRIGRKW